MAVMHERTCEVCGRSFEASASWVNATGARTCSRRCAGLRRADQMRGNTFAAGRGRNSTSFAPGIVPWNKGTKGVMKRNSGSFAAGRSSARTLAVGSVTVRRDKQGNPRRWIKTETGWIEYARFLWASHFGPIPRGFVIHHASEDSMDDRSENLKALSKSEHARVHKLSRWSERAAE